MKILPRRIVCVFDPRVQLLDSFIGTKEVMSEFSDRRINKRLAIDLELEEMDDIENDLLCN